MARYAVVNSSNIVELLVAADDASGPASIFPGHTIVLLPEVGFCEVGCWYEPETNTFKRQDNPTDQIVDAEVVEPTKVLE